MAADIFDFDGWDVRFLGSNVPQASILSAIEEHQATVVGLSATMLFNARRLASIIDAIKSQFSATRVIVGGSLVVNRFIDAAAMGGRRQCHHLDRGSPPASRVVAASESWLAYFD